MIQATSKHAFVTRLAPSLLVVSVHGRLGDADLSMLEDTAKAVKRERNLLCLYDAEHFEDAPPRVVERGFHWVASAGSSRSKTIKAHALVLPSEVHAQVLVRGVASAMQSPLALTLYTSLVTALRGLGRSDAAKLAKTIRALRLSHEPTKLLGKPLTDRETQIVACVLDGASDLNIATILGLAESTIGSHLERIYNKCGVHSRTELARYIRTNPSSFSQE